ncbi:MAG: histone deacetylase, partial [Phascolarctobacterium sp.]|nr:histone deacetylase [Phascolarctobacterium sp.]
KELLQKCNGVWQRKKHIYYDEEGIREQQVETIRYCNSCSGYFTIQTAAEDTRFGDQSAFIVCLPRDICPSCRQKAYDEALREKKTKRWQYVFVQQIVDGFIETI